MTAVHNSSGAYVVNALSGAERAAFEHHMDRCSTCAQEVTELNAVIAWLAADVAERPAPALRDRVLAAVDTTRQEPPVVAVRAAADVLRRHHAKPWRRVVAVAATVAAVAAAAAAVFVLGSSAGRPGSGPEQAVAAVLSAPDVEVDSGVAGSGATVTAVVSRRHGQVVLTARRLPALRTGRVYQVWLVGRDGPRSAGLLPPAGPGGAVLLADLPADTARIDVTDEPAGGSLKPTTPNVIGVGLG